MFSGHVLGNEFLNSVHGKATGSTVVPNSLGKYDIAYTSYTSAFKGYTCWQSSTSNSPAKTKADGENKGQDNMRRALRLRRMEG